jgi:hypothetical protein
MPEACGPGAQAGVGGPPEGVAPVCGEPQNGQKAVPSLRVALQVEHLIIAFREQQYTPFSACFCIPWYSRQTSSAWDNPLLKVFCHTHLTAPRCEAVMFDAEIPSRYIEAHYEPSDRLAVVLINRETGAIKQEFGSAEFLASPRYQAHLRAANAHGADVYLTVNTLKPDARRRTKTDVAAIRHLYLDIDEGGPATLSRLLLDRDMPKPHSVLESSPGKYQVLWQVENFSPQHAETVVRGLARRFGADAAVWDTARVLRLPGFRNHKYETPHYVVEIPNSAPSYRLRPLDFPAFTKATPQAVEPGDGTPHRQAGSHHSQSERDWAFANRALDRGEDPAVIKQKIASFRHDKHNPVSYAERTVDKAQTARNPSPTRPHRRSGNSHGPGF